MKLAVDARCLTTAPTGVGHYLMAALNVWAVQSPDIDFVLLAHKPLHGSVQALLVRAPNLRFVHAPAPRLPGNGLWWLLAHFEQAAMAQGATALWGAAGLLPPRLRRGMASLVTVHDLVYKSLPATMSWRARAAYGLLAGRSIRRAGVLWAVSQFTAGEVARHYPQRRAGPIIVGSGLNPLRAARTVSAAALASVRQRYAINERSLLFVGTLEPRKNLGFLLSLMPVLAQRGYRLVVVGCAGWGRSGVAAAMGAPGFPREAVQFCDYLPDDDLQALYRCATLFISTSLMEGFGLPHLEAMAAGCPVVAPANSAMPEVVGDGGICVTGWQADDWLRAIETASAERAAYGTRAAARAQAAALGLADACAQAGTALTDASAGLPRHRA